jgi:hypothetical protein
VGAQFQTLATNRFFYPGAKLLQGAVQGAVRGVATDAVRGVVRGAVQGVDAGAVRVVEGAKPLWISLCSL